jgi:hypothetical protein
LQHALYRAAQRQLLDPLTLPERERRWPPTAIARVQRVEPVSVEVVDDVADPVGAGEGDVGDPRHRHDLR